MPGLEATSYQDDLALLEKTVRAAGELAKRFYGGEFQRWNKPGGSPVSEADLAVDAFLKDHLMLARRDYGWLSEESTDDAARLDRLRVFVVDPIDGTVAFLKHKPHFTICAAVVEAGRPRAGVVFNPITDEMFTACEGFGAYRNGAAIHVADRDSIEGAQLLGSKATFEQGWPHIEIASFSSIAYRAVLVAAGAHDAMVSLTVKHDWDLAAADLIVREAGGLMTNEAGAVPLYNRAQPDQPATIAAGPRLHGLLLAHLAKLRC